MVADAHGLSVDCRMYSKTVLKSLVDDSHFGWPLSIHEPFLLISLWHILSFLSTSSKPLTSLKLLIWHTSFKLTCKIRHVRDNTELGYYYVNPILASELGQGASPVPHTLLSAVPSVGSSILLFKSHLQRPRELVPLPGISQLHSFLQSLWFLGR